jgi:hypothetical protein
MGLFAVPSALIMQSNNDILEVDTYGVNEDIGAAGEKLSLDLATRRIVRVITRKENRE